uniref:Uncharacterized protein n=1 Tax=Tanacetum cinerariifolium TaxID=118510 RepID=A0A699H8M5_TANCI|nr:hypothetical protein [Tanacetum cinerariifolium]
MSQTPARVLTKFKLIPITTARPVTTVVPKPHVTRPRQAKTVVTKPHSPPRRHINYSPSPKASTFPLKVTAAKAPMFNAVKGVQEKWEWKPKCPILDHVSQHLSALMTGNPQHALKDKGVINSGCSRHMTGNMSYLSDFEELNGGYVAFCGNPKGGKISGKGKIRTGKLDFDDVYFVKELKFNVFSVSQMCDKKNSVLFTDIECLVLSLEFKLPDENQVLLRVPRKNNMYNVDLKNIVPSGDLTFLWDEGDKEREFSVPRTPQQNEIGERKNRTLIGATRTILADSLLPIPFWTEAVNTACYVQNRILVTKSQNKTPYEFLLGRTPSIGFMRPFSCPMTIFNTLDPLGKFDGKVDGGFSVGYSVSSKAYRLFNSRTRIIQETLHINFLENKPNIACSGPTWLFDIDTLTKNMNYQSVTAGNKSKSSVGKKPESEVHVSPSSSAHTKKHDDKTKREPKGKSHVESSIGYRNLSAKFEIFSDNSINEVNAVDSPVLAVGQISTNSTNTFSVGGPSNIVVSLTHGKSSYVSTSQYTDDTNMLELEDITYSDDEEDVGAEADFTNLETTIIVSPIPTTRVHKDHPVAQIIGDLSSATQTRSMTRVAKDQGNIKLLKIQVRIEAMQKELLQFKMQKVWVLVDLPHGKRAIEVFAPISRIEAIRLFLAYASFMGFMVYQMDVKSAFLYGTIEKEVYVYQPLGFEDPDYPDKVYKVVKALYGLHQAPGAWYETLANYLLENGFQMGKIDQTLFIKRQKGDILLVQIYVDDIIFGSTNKDLCKAFEKLMKDKFQMILMGELTFFLGLQVKQKQDGIFISQDKYVAEISRKFGLIDGKSASTPIDTDKPLLKDLDGEDMDVHTYRSMIGSLMYLTSPRPDIMFAVCACAHFQVKPKVSHLHAVKKIFRYLKGKPHLGLWYPKDSPFNLVAYLDSDYAGASLDRKSTTGGCQFLGCRLISWQCKKQTVMATSSTEAEYVAAAICCVAQSSMKSLKRNLHVTHILSAGSNTTPQMNVNDVTKLQALVDKKKVIITEAIIRDALRLDDAESIDCFPNEEIFTELSRMGTLWNEFSSSMASAVICLSTGDLSSHSTKYSSPALTQKVFANMRRVGKGFSRVDTPLFEGMIMAQQDDDVADEGVARVAVNDVPDAANEPSTPSPTPTTQPPSPPQQDLPSTSQQDKIAQSLEIIKLKQRVKKLERKNKVKVSKLRRLKMVGTAQRVDISEDTVMDDVSKQGRIIANIDTDKDITLKDVADIAKKVVVDAEIKENADVQRRQAESQAQIYQIDLEHADKVLSMQDDKVEPAEIQEVVEVVTIAKLITEVVTAASATITTVATPILSGEITTAPSAARRRKGVVIRDLEETATPSSIIHSEPKSKDKGKGIMVEEPKPLKKQAYIEQDEAYARENMVGFKVDYFEGMSYDDIRPIFEKKFNSNVAFLEKTREQMEEEDSKALKRTSESQAKKAAKKQKLDEEVKELKRHLQIVPNDEDNVYNEATPLALKVPIVDYAIHTENNKPYFKIIRADETHQLFLSFLSLLRNFDREDLEVL